MKLKAIVDSKEALARLVKCKLPIGITWELKKFIKKVEPELITFEELRNQTIVRLGEELPEGGVRVKPENMKEFLSIVGELYEKEIEVTVPQVKLGDIVNVEDLTISTEDLIILDWLITE